MRTLQELWYISTAEKVPRRKAHHTDRNRRADTANLLATDPKAAWPFEHLVSLYDSNIKMKDRILHLTLSFAWTDPATPCCRLWFPSLSTYRTVSKLSCATRIATILNRCKMRKPTRKSSLPQDCLMMTTISSTPILQHC